MASEPQRSRAATRCACRNNGSTNTPAPSTTAPTRLSYWGEPLLVPVTQYDRLSDVRSKVARKLRVPEETVAAWRWFAVSQTSAPELLSDEDGAATVGERLHRIHRTSTSGDDLGVWWLAAEHPDARPLSKRRAPKRMWSGRGDGGIRIG